MRTPAVLQLDQMDCGPACLRYVLNCFGGDATVTDIRRRCELTDSGLSLLGMSRVAPELGLGARFFEATRTDPSLGDFTPWIAQLHSEDDGTSHYVVVDRIGTSGVSIMDPSVGHVRIPAAVFAERWTGIMATFADTGVTLRRRDDFAWARRWIRENPRPKYLLVSFLGAALTGLLGIGSAYVLKAVADSMISAPLSAPFWTAVIALLAFFLIQFLVGAGTTYVTEALAARMSNRSSSTVADLVRRLPWGHVAQMRHGDLVNRLKDPADVERFLIVTCGRLASTVLGFIAGLTWIAALYPGMIPAVVVALALAIGSFQYFRRHLVSISYRQKSREVAIDTGLMDYARCREMLTAATSQDLLLDRFRTRLVDLNRLHVHRIALLSIMGFFAALCPLIVMGWSVFRLWHWGDGTPQEIGDLVFQISATSFIFAGISSALSLVAGLDTMRVSFDRIMDVDLGSGSEAAPHPQRTDDAALARLETFVFAVGPKRATVSLFVEPGPTDRPTLVALTGPNGVGKSSLLRTLAGAAPISGGTAQLCNSELSTCADFQSLTAYMPQQDQLFTATMLENVTLGRPTAPGHLGQIAQALRLPREARTAADLASVPIQNGGDNLSGGQARRIALARALVMRKPVLLLDEPFAGLDRSSVAHVLTFLQQQTCELIILISHEDEVLARCDQVIELSSSTSCSTSDKNAPSTILATTHVAKRAHDGNLGKGPDALSDDVSLEFRERRNPTSTGAADQSLEGLDGGIVR